MTTLDASVAPRGRVGAATAHRLDAMPTKRPRSVELLVRSGPVPTVVSVILLIIAAPFLVFDTRLVPTATVLLVASLGYLIGARRLARREPGSWAYLGIASLLGIVGLVSTVAVCESIADRQDAHAALVPCCGTAFTVPTLVFLLGTGLSFTRTVRGWVRQG